jgi:hypothetical protein
LFFVKTLDMHHPDLGLELDLVRIVGRRSELRGPPLFQPKKDFPLYTLSKNISLSRKSTKMGKK